MTEVVEQAASAPAPEVRVSIQQDDRLCTGCGFNLIGQPVVREPVYRMLMVRCPECSVPAALQEYPVLGKWAGRWAALLGALWLAVMLAAMVATTATVGGMAAGAAQSSSTKFAEFISERHSDWLKALEPAKKAALQQMVTMPGQTGPYVWLDKDWWDSQDRGALVRDAGGWRIAMSGGLAVMWFLVVLAGVGIGAFWSVAFLGARRWKLVLLVLAPVALAGVIGVLVYAEPSGRYSWGPGVMAFNAATEVLAPRVFAATLAICPLGLWLGVWIGRPLLRAMVRGLLPPRMAGGLSVLWTADGLMPPRAKRPG
jgi:hypothetical protein